MLMIALVTLFAATALMALSAVVDAIVRGRAVYGKLSYIRLQAGKAGGYVPSVGKRPVSRPARSRQIAPRVALPTRAAA